MAREVSGVRFEVGGAIGGEISPVWLLLSVGIFWACVSYLEDHPSDRSRGLGGVDGSVIVRVCDQGEDLGGELDRVAKVVFRLCGLARYLGDGCAGAVSRVGSCLAGRGLLGLEVMLGVSRRAHGGFWCGGCVRST